MKTFDALRRPAEKTSGARDELVAFREHEFQVKTGDRGLLVKPNGTYNFVRVQGKTRGETSIFLSSKSGHAQLAGGQPVIYAGTIRFDSGQLNWWSNYSGTYQPLAAFSDQARLPDDRFVPWQRLQMGGYAMQRGMFNDRRDVTVPTRAEPRSPSTATNTVAAPSSGASAPVTSSRKEATSAPSRSAVPPASSAVPSAAGPASASKTAPAQPARAPNAPVAKAAASPSAARTAAAERK